MIFYKYTIVYVPEIIIFTFKKTKCINPNQLLTMATIDKSNSVNRVLSLDVFRGLTIATMILVNNPGNRKYTYTQLDHSEWNGCTVTDLVFPFFLFIIGVSIFFALDSKKSTIPSSTLIFAATRRALILFGLSLFLFLFPKVFVDPLEALRTVRVEGVLERIAIVYFVCTIIFIKTTIKTQLKLMILFLIVYWAMITFIPVPGVGHPNMGTDTNLVAWLDQIILTPSHLLHGTWDPQGILSNIPAFSTTLLGILTGYLLKRKDLAAGDKVSWIFTIGVGCTIIGLLWDSSFPINKLLWTSSYVLYAGGLASIGLALCYWLIDVQGYSRWTMPFVAFGRNAITIYFLSELIPRILDMIKISTADGKTTTLRSGFAKMVINPLFSSPYNASLAHGITYVLFFFIIAWWMYRKNIIVKI